MSQEVKKENNNKTLSVGIIGAGELVTKVHLPVLLNHNELCVKWITDIDSKKAESLAKAYKIQYIPYKKEDPARLPETDIVLLAIPYGARESYYAEFKKRQLALYVEKPFSVSLEQHKHYSSGFAPYKIACGFQRRSWGPTLTVKDLIRNKVFGKLLKINFGLGSPAGFVGLASFFSNLELAGGGILFDVGIHGIDAMLFCTDTKFVDFNFVEMIFKNGFDIHTQAEYTIKDDFNNIIKCNILISSLEETINKLEFIFENTSLEYSLFDTEGKITIKSQDKFQVKLAPMYPLTSFQTFYEHWSSFIKGIKTREVNRTSALESLYTTELIELLYKKARKTNLN